MTLVERMFTVNINNNACAEAGDIVLQCNVTTLTSLKSLLDPSHVLRPERSHTGRRNLAIILSNLSYKYYYEPVSVLAGRAVLYLRLCGTCCLENR